MSDKLKIDQSITSINSSGLGSGGSLNNEFYGKDDVLLADDFKLINLKEISFVLDEDSVAVSGVVFDSLLAGIDRTKVSFLHIQAHKQILTISDKPEPRRFDLKYGNQTHVISQYQLANTTQILNFSIEDVQVPLTEKTILTILIGFHTI